MSFLLEKLAARAAAKHWDSLSQSSKDRLRALDPDSAYSKYRQQVGKMTGENIHKIRAMGGKTQWEESKRGVPFKKEIGWSTRVDGDFKKPTNDGRFTFTFHRPNRTDELYQWLHLKDNNQLRANDLRNGYMEGRSGLGERPGRGQEKSYHAPVGLKEIKEKHPDVYKSIREDVLSRAHESSREREKRRRSSASDLSYARNIDRANAAVDSVHETSEGKHMMAEFALREKRGLKNKSWFGAFGIGRKDGTMGIGTHAHPGVLIDESRALRGAPKSVKDENKSTRAQDFKISRDGLKNLILMYNAAIPNRARIGERLRVAKDIYNENLNSQASIFSGRYGKKIGAGREKKIIKKVDDIQKKYGSKKRKITHQEVSDYLKTIK